MTQLLQTAEGTISYSMAGETHATGPLLICAPGIGDLRSEYRYLAPLLAAQGWSVALMDLRGHGESSVTWSEFTPQAVGRDMLALANHLGHGTPVLLAGCSMAAASAVWAAVEAPAQVAGVVLLGPSLEDGPLSPMQSLALKTAFVGPWKVRAWDLFYASLYPGPKPADLDAHRAAIRASLREPGRFDALRAFLFAPKAEAAARIERLAKPALLVMGSRDPDFSDPAAVAQGWARRLKADHFVVDGAGHYPHVDTPQAVADRLLRWAAANSNFVLPAHQSAAGNDAARLPIT